MTAVERPGTPFPYTHVLHHTSTSSTFAPMSPGSYFAAQPLHFTPRELPARTPPSLLNRTPSASSSSRISLSRTPSLVQPKPRRNGSITASSEGSTSPVLRTPTNDAEEPFAPHPTPFELPSPAMKRGIALPPPEYNWTDKEFTATTSFDIFETTPDICHAEPVHIPSHPALQRRDTSRPEPSGLSHSRADSDSPRRTDVFRGKRQLTSMVDGGKWIVMDEE